MHQCLRLLASGEQVDPLSQVTKFIELGAHSACHCRVRQQAARVHNDQAAWFWEVPLLLVAAFPNV